MRNVWTVTLRAPRPTSRRNKKAAPDRDGLKIGGVGLHAENDFPQPQELWAVGLLILNPPPVNASLKSMTAPRM